MDKKQKEFYGILLLNLLQRFTHNEKSSNYSLPGNVTNDEFAAIREVAFMLREQATYE